MRFDFVFALLIAAGLFAAGSYYPEYDALKGAGVGAAVGSVGALMAGLPAGAGMVAGGAAGGLYLLLGGPDDFSFTWGEISRLVSFGSMR